MNIEGKHILDVTCGSRSIWFQKECKAVVYCDKRTLEDEKIWKSTKNDSIQKISVNPDIICDFTDLPFQDNCFELVVFDPPHMQSLTENAWMAKKYGVLPKEESFWKQMIHDGFTECMRVLKPFGTLIFKWNETEIPTREVIKAIGTEPLFGHKSGKKSLTHWMCFMKMEDSTL